MKPAKIALIGGDGIGPEVVREGRLLLELVREERNLPLELWELDLGADRYLRDGTTFPAEVRVAIQRECAAVLLGALGDPRVPGMEHARDILFGMRQGYDLFANVRPCRALSDRLVPLKGRGARDVDFVVFRENTEGIYVGMGGQFKRGTPDEVAINEDINTRKGVERIIRTAFEFAKKHGHSVVHMADKSNAMRHAHELWLRVFDQISREYAPDIRGKHVYVDALCLYLIQDPSQFRVIVTNNLFGDIITDLGAALQGGLGMASSANVHGFDAGRVAMFEPVHGSAPDLAGKGAANPFACLLTVGMMLAHLGYPEEEQVIEAAVARAIDERQCTPDVGGTLGTQAAAAWVREEVRQALRALHSTPGRERLAANALPLVPPARAGNLALGPAPSSPSPTSLQGTQRKALRPFPFPGIHCWHCNPP
ncbi:MAG: isocitrate/isopropylmalate dehydrogenase family protein [Myxococcales bacterium]|nr:isocitrate/isopropylmalate dehydrogenase family protein [Polyangiaceae bacterium]MDW8250048.1 isocitrate/isopropylmalate dehydrogenase family protein [Myxococcales bacterium]